MNAECIPVVGVCNEVVGLNKSFLEKHNGMRAKIKQLASCQKLNAAEIPDYLFTECIKEECTVRRVPKPSELKIVLNDNEMKKVEREIDKIRDLEKAGKYQECFEAIIVIRNRYKVFDGVEQLFYNCHSAL